MSYVGPFADMPMHAGLREIEQALPETLLERCVVVGPAAARRAMLPSMLSQPETAPRLTLALTHDDWSATAVSIAECLMAADWQQGRTPLPEGICSCSRSGHWPLEFVHRRLWRVTLVLADGLTGASEAPRLYRLRTDEILLPAYAAGDVATHAPLQVANGTVRVADPRYQMLADLLACASPLLRENVAMRHGRAAQAIGIAALMSPADLGSLSDVWPFALESAGYPVGDTLQLVSSSLVDTLEHTSALHRDALTLFGEAAPTWAALEAAQRALLALMARTGVDLD